jgi:hypothetical protein
VAISHVQQSVLIWLDRRELSHCFRSPWVGGRPSYPIERPPARTFDTSSKTKSRCHHRSGYEAGANAPSNQRRHICAHSPKEGIADFRAYEDAVLPLLVEFNGCLERRLRNADGTVEVHIVSFASETDFQDYRNDPRRTAHARLLEKSAARLDLLPMQDV